MKMKAVPVKDVDDAIASALQLIEHLKKIRAGAKSDLRHDPIQLTCNLMAERIEKGESLENMVGEIERLVLIALIKRGCNTSEKLAGVLKKSHVNTRQILHNRRISLRQLKGQEK